MSASCKHDPFNNHNLQKCKPYLRLLFESNETYNQKNFKTRQREWKFKTMRF